ncbi:DUF1194 domain-containing protein [Primorskyibacter sp. S187A]|uniref:DUF1194 domain-containing protein n=1 Tax=Primorskyibacter sp. S187A TaxID=3415130 RepID=UPI003C7A845E
MRLTWLALLFVIWAGATSACRQALVLALDVSGSVDGLEYQQQVSGLAFALGHPDIRAILLADTDNPVTLAVFEWSSRNHQFLILPWTDIDSAAALEGVIARIESHRKVRAGLKTALGTALSFGRGLLAQRPACWKHTIDVSGDGRNNVGPLPRQVYGAGFDRITVNALVIGNPRVASGEGPGIEPNDLRTYFEAEVIHGPGAFALVANGYADYARAMKRKLERELELPFFSRVNPDR